MTELPPDLPNGLSLATSGMIAEPVQKLCRDRTASLSKREVEVVCLVARGLTNQEIADRLFVSPRTIQSHVAKAFSKTGSASRTDLAVLAVREGLVPLVDQHEADAEPRA